MAVQLKVAPGTLLESEIPVGCPEQTFGEATIVFTRGIGTTVTVTEPICV